MEAIILSITPYKEKDAIINALSKEEVFSFQAKGILSSSSKNIAINNPLTFADLEFVESKAGKKILKSSDIKFTPMELMGKAMEMTLIMILQEVVAKCLENDEKITIYNNLVSLLKNIKKSKYIYTSTLFFLFDVLKVSGYEFNVGGCHICGSKKDIAAFSFDDGGFICKNCLGENHLLDLSGEQILEIRKIYLTSNLKDINFEISKDDFIPIFKKTILFIQDCYGLKLKNTELLFE